MLNPKKNANKLRVILSSVRTFVTALSYSYFVFVLFK